MNCPKLLISYALSAGLACAAAAAVPTAAYADKFQTCVKGFWPAAKRAGVSWDTFQKATAGISRDPEVIESARYQPEYKKPMGEYVDRGVSPRRLSTGQERLNEYGPLLEQIEAKYGVDKHIVVAIWGLESNYGSNKGEKHVIQSLMTLACSGVKAKFARGQINAAFKIIQNGDTDTDNFGGSWAGAMGHTQFIPTTYAAYAVDFDGDGRRDIWNTIPDALGSTAAYLKKSGWRSGQTWGYEVKLSKGYTAKRYKRGKSRTLAQWQKAGVTRANGQPFPRPGDKAQLLSPDGRNGPSFLVLNNFRSLLRYNNADSYALAVGHLADRLAGQGPFIQQWPTSERRLSMEQRMELQRHLIALGHLEGEVDGIIGSGTLGGVRSYQRAKGMAVDGYPTQTILKKLRAEAPAVTPVAAPQSTASIPAAQPAQAGVVPQQYVQPQTAAPTQAAPMNGVQQPQAVQQYNQSQAATPQALPAQAALPQGAPQLMAPAQPQAALPQAGPPQAMQPQASQPQAAPPQPVPAQAVQPEYSPPGHQYGYAIIPVQPQPAGTMPWHSGQAGAPGYSRSAAEVPPPAAN
ncbi:MAG: lytic murein transglycosylase [Methyloceanibacter sp.]|nr:lytic murein transglycosylase [Methyloceanibacter sp.]